MTAGLSVSDIVNVQVTLSPAPVQTRNFGTLLVLGTSAVMSTTETLRAYTSATSLGNDFAVNTPEYQAGSLFFAQSPQPALMYVGRWNSVASGGSETLAAAVQRLAAASGDWYGLVVASATVADSDILSAAQVIESAGLSRAFFVTTMEAATLVNTSTSDLAATLHAADLSHTTVIYSSTSPYAGASLFGRFATVDYTAANSTITGMFKVLPGVTYEVLTETQAATLTAKCCNVFVLYQVGSAIVQNGVMSNGDFIDERINMDWLQNALQVQGFNTLYGANKVPQTDVGMGILSAAYTVICNQAVYNGMAAPGVWSGPAFGVLSTNQVLANGFYVYMPPVATQSIADRAARKAVTCQIAMKLAGAVHESNVSVLVVR